MIFNREQFFKGYRSQFGSIKESKTVFAIEELLDFIEKDPDLYDIRHVAYMLATAAHETAWTFLPIAEYGKGKGRPYGVPDKVTKQTYYGRGLVQLTHKYNYQWASEKLGVDFVHNPDLVMRPDYAYKIMSLGMRTGAFTGKKLSDYINRLKCDYKNARRIINGTDRAGDIEEYAKKFEAILKASLGVSCNG